MSALTGLGWLFAGEGRLSAAIGPYPGPTVTFSHPTLTTGQYFLLYPYRQEGILFVVSHVAHVGVCIVVWVMRPGG